MNVETWTILAGVFGAGVTYALMRGKIDKAAHDVDGVGKAIRNEKAKSERRWKQTIATNIETAKSLEEAKSYARLLRDDSWRD